MNPATPRQTTIAVKTPTRSTAPGTWLPSASFIVLQASAGSGNLRPLDGFGSADDLAERGVGGVPVPPGDVAADHAGLLLVGAVVGAVEGEVAKRGELGLDSVEPGAVERDVGQFDVVRGGPLADPGVGLGG